LACSLGVVSAGVFLVFVLVVGFVNAAFVLFDRITAGRARVELLISELHS
jgi:hypothetical protein